MVVVVVDGVVVDVIDDGFFFCDVVCYGCMVWFGFVVVLDGVVFEVVVVFVCV